MEYLSDMTRQSEFITNKKKLENLRHHVKIDIYEDFHDPS